MSRLQNHQVPPHCKSEALLLSSSRCLLPLFLFLSQYLQSCDWSKGRNGDVSKDVFLSESKTTPPETRGSKWDMWPEGVFFISQDNLLGFGADRRLLHKTKPPSFPLRVNHRTPGFHFSSRSLVHVDIHT